MSRGLNSVQVFGGLVRDPEVKHGQSGGAWISFTLAAGYSVKNQQTNEWEQRTDYIPCKTFGSNAENIGKYCKKGDRLLITGRIRTESWERNGEKVYSTMVYADTVIFGERANNNGGNNSNATHSSQPQQTQPRTQNAQGGGYYQPSQHEQSKANGYAPQGGDGWSFGSDPGFTEDSTADIPF